MKIVQIVIFLNIILSISCTEYSFKRGFSENLYNNDKVTDIKGYISYVPEIEQKRYPLIIYMHGAGSRGAEVSRLYNTGLPKVMNESGLDYNFIMIAPQAMPGGSYFSNELSIFLNDIEKLYPIDKNRIYLTGFSMGAVGIWNWALNEPKRFAAIAPIGGAPFFVTEGITNDEAAKKLIDLPIWVFHGDNDKTISLEFAVEAADVIKELGGEVKYTIYEGFGHEGQTETYNNLELFEWFLKHEL